MKVERKVTRVFRSDDGETHASLERAKLGDALYLLKDLGYNMPAELLNFLTSAFADPNLVLIIKRRTADKPQKGLI